MLENLNDNEFKYQRLSAEEQAKRGILGRLVGIIADFKHPTRNGRLYKEELWEKVFEDPIMKEKLANRCLFGELGHPTDRIETDMEKIAICLAEKPKKTKDGKLKGVFDILNTPNGRILKALCDYGCQIGVSSRGEGDIVEDFNGNQSVDCDTYQCECWDAVLIPAVESARMSLVTESLNNKTLKQALNEQLDKATPDEQKVMKETLNQLNIEYTSEKSIDKSTNNAANDIGATIVKQLQESLLKQQSLEAQMTELQEKLSVSYAKEAKYEEDIAKYKNAIRNLSESASNVKALQSRVNSLQEELKSKDSQIQLERDKQSKLLEKHEIGVNRQRSLNETISKKTAQLTEANRQIQSLNEDITQIKQRFEADKQSLNESLAEVKKNLSIKTTEYSTKLSNANKLVEQYRQTAKTAVDRYIESKAIMLDIDKNEVKNKLPSNYSFKDIDSVCESLSAYKLKISNLSFNLSKDSKIAVKESKEPILPKSRFDDTVDESLLRLAGLN